VKGDSDHAPHHHWQTRTVAAALRLDGLAAAGQPGCESD